MIYNSCQLVLIFELLSNIAYINHKLNFCCNEQIILIIYPKIFSPCFVIVVFSRLCNLTMCRLITFLKNALSFVPLAVSLYLIHSLYIKADKPTFKLQLTQFPNSRSFLKSIRKSNKMDQLNIKCS